MNKDQKWPVSDSLTERPEGAKRLGPAVDTGSWNTKRFIVCFCLLIAVISVFSGTLRNGFVNYDDDAYVYANPVVARGITTDGLQWAFTGFHSGNWHPVTWISHMLDCQLYGLNAGGHHLTSVLIHAASAVLLFLLLHRMTRDAWKSREESFWCSVFVAVLFAIHPLRVESVAWVAERKDVLSGLFFMLTLMAYVHYVRSQRIGAYLLVLAFFALGLMSKPMLVTVPFVLLLLDYWPLRRRFVLLEKLPLILLSIVSCVVTLLAQKEATVPVDHLAFSSRIGNALVSCVTYLWQTILPLGLAVHYPHKETQLPVVWVLGSFLFIAGVTLVVYLRRKTSPYLIVGWLWFMGMLMPVIGLMQVGEQAHADRYTYLPLIGIYVLFAWGVASGCASKSRRILCGIVVGLFVIWLMFLSWVQTLYWRNSVTLWTHALRCTSRNALANNNLGVALYSRGKADAAIMSYRRAIEINPEYDPALNNLGIALAEQGDFVAAIASFKRIIALNPNSADVHNNLGSALASLGRTSEAVEHFQLAVKADPDFSKASINLAGAFQTAGKYEDAIQLYAAVLNSTPENLSALNGLAWLMASCPDGSYRNSAEAVKLSQKAEVFSGGKDPVVLDILAAAYAEAGLFPEAVETAGRAIKFANESNKHLLAESIRQRLELYELGLPYHQTMRP